MADEELYSVEDVDNFLRHYASEYYDPAKAKAYYEANKRLKGRKKAQQDALSDDARQKQSEATSYVRNQISTKRTTALDSAAAAQKARLEDLQAKAEATSAAIQKKLADFLAKVQKQTPIPANASPKLRAYLERSNKSRVQGQVKLAKADLQKLGTELRDSVKKAREDYSAQTKSLRDKFTKDLETETKNIQEKVR